jgi:outer membrane murein-binding lipoprotein Lpp
VWKDRFVAGGIEGLKRREQDESQELQELRAKVGELTMQVELYRKNRPAPGRSRRHSR